jgi:hypothetical protein
MGHTKTVSLLRVSGQVDVLVYTAKNQTALFWIILSAINQSMN